MLSARSGTDGFQETVESGCAGSQQPTSHLGVESEMTMALYGLHQVGQRGLQVFPANAVGDFPDHDHRFSHSLIVDATASHGVRCAFIVVRFPKQPDPVLAVVSGDRDELVEDPALVFLGRAPVTVSYRCQ